MATSNTPLARAIVRTHAGSVPTDTLDVASLASVEVSSEQELYPIDNVFDGRVGQGGSCWVAASYGAQTVNLRFHAPTDIESVTIESEELGITCTQQIDVAGWSAHREAGFESPARVLHYSPYGPSFHREVWELAERGVTHLWLRVTPAPLLRLASLTAIILR